MMRRLTQLTLFIFLLAAPAYADPVVLTFDNVPGDVAIIRSYTESGFTFSGLTSVRPFGPGNNVIVNNSYHVTEPMTIRINWMGGGTFDLLGVDYIYGSGRSVFRGSNGVSVDLHIAVRDGFSGFNDLVWLDWVHYGFTGEDFGSNPIGLDNFRFNTGPIPTPEPATLLLLGSGLLGVVGAARKRRRS